MRRHAFTLVELLVVIAIIGLLSTVAVVATSGARMKARDVKRKADFSQIRLALELFNDQYGRYPSVKQATSCGGTSIWAESKGTCGGQWLTTDAAFYSIMASVPQDPVNTGSNAALGDGNYVYSYATNSPGTYELMTQLESPSDPDRCGVRPAIYHAINVPWCPPWPNNMDRSQNIYADH